jgi:hypothetical protein
MDRCYESTAKSIQVSYILEIDLKELLELMESHPLDYVNYFHNQQRYCEIKDLVKLSNKLDEIGVICKACNKKNHIIQQCPMILGTPNRAKVLLNYRRITPNDRLAKERSNDRRRINAIGEQFSIQESVINYLLKDEGSHNLYLESQYGPEMSPLRNLKSNNMDSTFGRVIVLLFARTDNQVSTRSLVVSSEIVSQRPLNGICCLRPGWN